MAANQKLCAELLAHAIYASRGGSDEEWRANGEIRSEYRALASDVLARLNAAKLRITGPEKEAVSVLRNIVTKPAELAYPVDELLLASEEK